MCHLSVADLCSLLAKMDAMTRASVAETQKRGLPVLFLRSLLLSHKDFQCKQRQVKWLGKRISSKATNLQDEY